MKRHAFVCPQCDGLTFKLFDGECLKCSQIDWEQEEKDAALNHRTGELAAPVIGHPGTF